MKQISSITQENFGHLPDGRGVSLYTLNNAQGMQIKISDFGGIITELYAPDREEQFADICLGFEHLAPYLDVSPYFGALIGPYGNRIAHGTFELDGQTYSLPQNNGAHHLHGGEPGFHRVLWGVEPFRNATACGLTLRYSRVHGAQGYPGNLEVKVTYELNDANELHVHYFATTDQATPVNLTQHTYFNLGGIHTTPDILGHQLMLNADRYTPVDVGLIPTGELAPVAGTPFDFRQTQSIGARIADHHQQLQFGQAYDHNYVLNKNEEQRLSLAARVNEPVSGRVLELWTEEPGLQLYSGNFLDGSLHGKGVTYQRRSGFCLEPQHFPDSPNQSHFPNVILRPGDEYHSHTMYRFLIQDAS
ncbi:aldose epimerase family protein [Undibacterium sp. Ji22W]|uniref:aldose epimerase family protein n=1 Tax=Undibacterium sp. Ji22W TaxID=3413038 RepID=UPI003BF137CC